MTTGKCSHGGKEDTTSNTIPAKGGINKETRVVELSPLAHLHDEANTAAKQATVDFFIGNGKNIRISNYTYTNICINTLNIAKSLRISLGIFNSHSNLIVK